MNNFTKIFTLIIVVFSTQVICQNNLPRLSPKAYVGQTVGYTNVKIEYGSPGVKEREIWGTLVPFDKVWRTGANEATTIEFDTEVLIDDIKVPKGKYSLFTIPGKSEWTVILNKVYEQWGAYQYDQESDLLRFKVKSYPCEFSERLKFSVEYIDSYKAKIILEWEKIKIEFEIISEIQK